jgi:hypothetical protein
MGEVVIGTGGQAATKQLHCRRGDRMAQLTAQQAAQAMIANDRWADRLGWRPYAAPIAVAIGTANSDPAAQDFAQGVAGWQETHDVAVDGIIGPQTWTALQRALAPPDSLTGIVPPDAPPVPDGFAAIVQTFGDPRPLLSPDGTINDANRAAWERQTLAKGQLPFPIPIDRKNPALGIKSTFYAHRRLVSSFVAVFSELGRLQLRDTIHSFDGIYNFRPIRGTTNRISLHAFGAAIDLNADTNPLGKEGDMDPRVIDVFRHFGFFWGGDFHDRPDPMHFQYATGY